MAGQFERNTLQFLLMQWTAFDAESFMWYLIWTTEQFEETGKLKNDKFKNWDNLSDNDSRAAKVSHLFRRQSITE
jgi:hypothetical protein